MRKLIIKFLRLGRKQQLLLGSACIAAIALIIVLACMLKGKEAEKSDTKEPTGTVVEGNAEVTKAAENTEAPEVTTAEATPTVYVDEHEGQVRSVLTNEWIDEKFADKRPIAVMMNNVKKAVPQTGISRAGVVYECMVEGNITRLMGIIQDYEDLEKIGSVRSCREYYVFWALEWDAIYLHYGGPKLYVADTLAREDVNNLDGTYLEGTVFYRTHDRVAPHNAYASGAGVLKGADKKGYSLTYTENYTGAHYKFAEEAAPTTNANGTNATHIEPGYSYNKPWFEYNKEDGLYYRNQYDDIQVDEMTGEQLCYKNVIFQFVKSSTLDHNGYQKFTVEATDMDGYYFTNGKCIPVTWKKTSDFTPTRYYDSEGNEIVLNTGKTWVCVVQNSKRDDVVIR